VAFGPVQCRFVRRVGWRATASVWWGEADTCQPGLGHIIVHELRRGVGETPPGAHEGWMDWHPQVGDPCDRCGAGYGTHEHHHAGGTSPVYDTPSGGLEVGNLFWADWHHRDEHGNPRPCPPYCGGWTNCPGRHLYAVTPDGHHWDIDSRASNCGLPQDHEHRCWCRHGDPEADPPTIHVDKTCSTCAAGGGSIDTGTYHGMLHHGAFTAG
jgi:hypothetical protein